VSHHCWSGPSWTLLSECWQTSLLSRPQPPEVLQAVNQHCVFCTPNRQVQFRLSLGCRHRSAHSSHFSSKLAFPLYDVAIPPSVWPSAYSYVLGSGIQYLTQCLLAPRGVAPDIIACTLHSLVCPSHCPLSPNYLNLLHVHLWHGQQVLPYDMCTSCFLLLLQVQLRFNDFVIRPHGIIPIQHCLFSKQSVGQGQVYDRSAIAVIPCPVLTGWIVICNYKSMLLYNFVRVCDFSPFCSPQVPEFAVGLEVSCVHHAASPLPHDFVPVYSARLCLSCLARTLIVNVFIVYHFLSPSFDIDDNDIIACVPAQVPSIVHCKADSLEHCCAHPHSLTIVVCSVADSTVCSFSRWYLQTHHIRLLLHPSLQPSQGSDGWPGAAVLDSSDHWG